MKRFFTLENLTLAGIVAGILFGVLMPDMAIHMRLVGKAFLDLLKMIALPLVFFSVFASVINLGNVSRLGDLGWKTVLYYLSTTFLAVLTGIVVVNLILSLFPPEPAYASSTVAEIKKFSIEDLVRSFIPSNIVKSFYEFQVLHVIIIAILFGSAALYLSDDDKTFVSRFVNSFDRLVMKVAVWIIALSPVGVFALVSYVIADKGLDVILSLWIYALAVVVGLVIHGAINLPAIGYFIGKFSPYQYFHRVKEALLIAFSTSSSAATLPVSLEVSTKKGQVREEVASFVLPLGATINMDGTALYESIAAIFVASLYGIKLTIGQQLVIFFTAALAAIGAAAIPSAGLVTMTLVFSAVGIPLEGIAIILSIDRFLDMMRTTVNVWGDLIGAKLIERFVSE